MKVTARRTRSDSAKAAVQAAQNAALGPHTPPDYIELRPQDKPYWVAIMQARPRHTWNESDLALAAQLARTRADMEDYQKRLEATVTAFALKQLDTLVKRNITLTRLLHVHPEATLGRAADSAKTATLQRETELEDDDLIPSLEIV